MEMFKYRVKWYDANGAGEVESGVVWEGFDRLTALEKKRECFEVERTITVLTPGPCGWRSAIQERWRKQEEEALQEAEAAYYDRMCLEREDDDEFDLDTLLLSRDDFLHNEYSLYDELE